MTDEIIDLNPNDFKKNCQLPHDIFTYCLIQGDSSDEVEILNPRNDSRLIIKTKEIPLLRGILQNYSQSLI
ncbi:MAG: hypothetical protein HON94_04830 [Methylococcales bacterium]|jgi:hypothetical protein|nr:hypothetical protein [Methylococcales bacterium]